MLDRIKAWFANSRTIFAARLLQIAGALTIMEPILAGEDWTPVLVRLFSAVPADLRPLAIGATVAAVGAVFEYLRRVTTGPISIPSLGKVQA